MSTAHWTSGWGFAILVSIGAFLLQSTLPVNVTFGQQLAPVSAATVSSLMMGFGWGSGALVAPLVGLLGDAMGLTFALLVTSIIPLFAALAAWPLPSGTEVRSYMSAAEPEPGPPELRP